MPDVMGLLGGGRTGVIDVFAETVQFSGKVKKFNKFDWSHDRMFVITNKKIYVINKGKLRRANEIAKLRGITKSLAETGAGEIILHSTDDYDFRMKSEQ